MMNERIKELAEQADYEAPGGQWKEYFAELIVRECAEIALREEHDAYECIKSHFGVE